MHEACMDFLVRMKALEPAVFTHRTVLEAGSLDMNGSPRTVIESPDLYVGVDFRPGRGVDVEELFHLYRSPHKKFGLVISTEMLEHDPYWILSIDNMVRHIGIGGSLLITAAAKGREPHSLEASPTPEYYGNLRLDDVLFEVLRHGVGFERLICEDDPVNKDIRIFAVRLLRRMTNPDE